MDLRLSVTRGGASLTPGYELCNPFRVVWGNGFGTRGGASLTPGYELCNPFRD